jgi:hypothetical protein
LYIYLRLKSFSVGGLPHQGSALDLLGALSGPQDHSPQVVPTFHFRPNYAPDGYWKSITFFHFGFFFVREPEKNSKYPNIYFFEIRNLPDY